MAKQKTLTAFFGGGGGAGRTKPKGGKVQTKLPLAPKRKKTKETTSAGGGGGGEGTRKKDAAAANAKRRREEKKDGSGDAVEETKDLPREKAEGVEAEEPEVAEEGMTKRKKGCGGGDNKRRRRVIDDDDDLVDTDDDEEEVDGGAATSATEPMDDDEEDDDEASLSPSPDDPKGKTKEASSSAKSSSKSKAKEVEAVGDEEEVEDKDDDYEEEEEEEEEEEDSSGDDDGDGSSDEEEEDGETLASKKAKSSSSTSKRTVNEALKRARAGPPTKTKSSSSSGATKKSSDYAANSVKPDADLLEAFRKSYPDANKAGPSTTTGSTAKQKGKKGGGAASSSSATATTSGGTPYAALSETFASIESISGRIAIQGVLTDLFRTIILLHSKDEEEKRGCEGGGDDSNGGRGGGGPTEEGEKQRVGAMVEDLRNVIYLASNAVAASYECVELGVGDAILIKAVGEAYGTNPAMIKQKYDKEGDLGTVAMTAKGKQRTLNFGMKPKPLSAREVLSVFRQIATTSGAQSQKWKVDKIKGLLVRAVGRNDEAKYIIRGLQGKLRIGLAQSTVLISLAHAVVLTPPSAMTVDREELDKIADGKSKDKYPESARRICKANLPLDEKLECSVSIVKKAYSQLPSFDALVDAALTVPLHELHRQCSLQPGIPVEPMLAKPTKSVLEVLKRLNGLRFTCEYKYDGERAQVHMTPDGTTKVFSRNLLDTSEKFPEVPIYVKEACSTTGVQSFVLDTEVVAYNRETKQFVPFQILSTRKKSEESEDSAKVQVIVQAFDLMYINGVSLLDQSLAERREQLRKYFLPVDGKFQFALSIDHMEDGTTTVIEEFLDAAVKGQCEGLMVKTLDDNALYEPSRRSLNWLKLKKDYLEGLGDSVDLVPIGAFHGKGKRTGVYGAYLLACYDEDTEEFQSVCKIGTGFSEEDLKDLAGGLNDHKIPEKSSQYNVSDSLDCDVWFDAVQVWEVKAADLSKSSTHKGAIDKTGEAGRGIGLRFPRFERLRPDKKPEQATTSDQILDMYYAQDTIVAGNGNGGSEDGI